MVMVEMAFSGAGGLEELVSRLAASVEGAVARYELDWLDEYPITLRESLRLGLQQQIIGGHALHCPPSKDGAPTYRVWIRLPDGGLRAWTDALLQRVLEGFGHGDAPAGDGIRGALQANLVAVLGPCLQRAEAASLLPGLAAV